MQKLVSIITPNFNNSNFIGLTIESVLNQTYTNWELIIVDDKSSDDSIEIINNYTQINPKIKLICNNFNLGVAVSRNIALNYATGYYIAFLDSDDLWKPTKLEEQILYMENFKIDFSFTAYEVINDYGTILKSKISVVDKINYKKYLGNTVIGCSTVIINKNTFKDINIPLIKSSQDMAYWLKLLKIVNYAYGIDKVLGSYRILSNSNSSNKINATLNVWKVYKNFENLNIFRRTFYFSSYVFYAIKKRVW